VVIRGLLDRGATVVAYDPVAMEEARHLYASEPRVLFADDALEAAGGADALVIVTEWKAFRSPDFDELKRRLASPVIFDGRNLYEPAAVRANGFEYFAIGRP
jgi:UDPglucose 6-dehydrogenase